MNESIPSELPDSSTYPRINQREVGSSIDVTSEAHGYNWISDDEDLYSEGFSESTLEKLRSILKSTQGNVGQCEEVINEITSFDEDLSTKCETITVTNLLPRNSTLADAGNFPVISVGVDILVKYGINLLKPKKHPNWRSIKLANGVLKGKVQPLKGYEDVLRELGYTEKNSASFDFLPSLQQPDIDKVAVVTADLLILQRELNQFINQTHINKERFLKYFSSLLKRDPLGGSLSTAGEGISLERISNQQNDPPKVGDASKGNVQVKTPVPAPRRNIPQVSPKEAKPPGQPQPSEKDAPTDSPLSTAPLTENDGIEIIPSVGPILHPLCNMGGHGVHGSGENLLAKPSIFSAWQDPPANMSAEGELAGPKATPHVPKSDHLSNPIKNQGSNASGLQTPVYFTKYPIEGNSKSEKAPSEVTIHKPQQVGTKNKPQVGFPLNQQPPQLSPQFVQPHPKIPPSAANFPYYTDGGKSRSQKEPHEVTTMETPLVDRRIKPPLPPKLRFATRSGSGTSEMNQEPLQKFIGKSVSPHSNEYKPSPPQPQRQLHGGEQPTPFTAAFPPASPVPGEVQPLQISGHINSAGQVEQDTPSGIKQQGQRETPTSSGKQSTEMVVSRPLVEIYIALYDYTQRTHRDLGFRKGETFEVLDRSNTLWWLARSTVSRREGYIPSNYVAEQKTLEAKEWHFSTTSRKDAGKRLMDTSLLVEKFLIRKSQTHTEMTNDPVYVVAKWDYTAKQKEDLAIKKNERLELTDDSRSRWKVRKTSGNYEMGYVPSNFVNKEKHETLGASAPDPGQLQQNQTQDRDIFPSPKIAVVKLKYEPQQEDELALNEGDIVYVLEMATNGWWKGAISGKSGWFPSNYVSEDLDRSRSSSKEDDVSSSLSSGDDFIHGVVTLYPFQCRNSEELKFEKGERLDIIELLDKYHEWWRARNKEGQVGLVPWIYVQKISDAVPVYSRLQFSNGDNVVVDSEVNKMDNSNEGLSGNGFHGKLSKAQSESVQENAAEENVMVQESEAFDPLQTGTKPKISSPVQVKPKANNKLTLIPPAQKIVQSQHKKMVLTDVPTPLEQIKTRCEGISDRDLEKQKMRKRIGEEHGLTWSEVDIVLALTEEYELCECVEAVKAVGNNLQRALDYFQECATCFTHFGMHKLVALPTCECLICTECFAQNFTELAKTTTCMYKFSCPVCNNPKLEDSDKEIYQFYFSLLGPLLKTYLAEKDYELYEAKLATWELMADPNFRWCAHGCSAGFIDERQHKKIQCPECKKYQCFDCKKPWLDQHKNISCEKFDAWKKANDPEFQQQGLAAHLKENGINCPKCKMRYELAKGGCMHFKCPQCHHQFCCGCNLPFLRNPACNLLPSCKGKGMHAHHPRDCFYYLRDENCHDLQQLLQKHKVHYKLTSIVASYNSERPQVCPVREQQETPDGLMDATCGKPLKDQCGLCKNHYKEYLVGLINQHNIDPVEVFGVKSLEATLRRNDRKIPLRAMNETNADYCARLRQEVQQLLPLRPRNAQGIAGAAYQI